MRRSVASSADEWLAYYREAEIAYEFAADRQMGIWVAEHRLSEGYLEAVERTAVARSRWEARLTALNAYMDRP